MNLKRLVTATLNVAATTHYTADTVTARIDAATLTNTSASDVTVSIWLPTGGSASTSNAVLQAKTVTAGGSYVVKELYGHVLEDGATIAALASTAGVVSLVVSGIEIAAAA